jgi:hypothetical protein
MTSRMDMIGELYDFVISEEWVLLDCGITEEERQAVVGPDIDKIPFSTLQEIYKIIFTKLFKEVDVYKQAIKAGFDPTPAKIQVRATWLGLQRRKKLLNL